MSEGAFLRAGRHVCGLMLITYKHPLKRKTGLKFYAEAVILPGSLYVDDRPPLTIDRRLVMQGVACHGSSGSIAYLELDCDALDFKLDSKRVLLEFSEDCTDCYQMLNIGHCYMQMCLDAKAFRGSKVVRVTVSSPLHSVCFLSSGVSRCELRPADPWAVHQFMLAKDKTFETCQGIKFVPCGVSSGEIVSSFISLVADLKTRFTPHIQRVSEILDKANAITITSAESEKCGGSLVSICGHVQRSSTAGCCSVFEFEVKDCYGPQVVLVLLDATKVVFPSNLRPGTLSSFCRVLMKRKSDGVLILESIATTLIIVHGVHNRGLSSSSSSIKVTLPCDLDLQSTRKLEKSRYISTLNSLRFLKEGVCLCCRTVAVKKLVLKWQQISKPKTAAFLSGIDIPCGCFIVDDGSGVAECWTWASSQIQMLLGLQSCAASNDPSNARMKESIQRLCSVVQKHGHVVYEKEHFEDAQSSRVVQGDRNERLCEADESVVGAFIRKTCFHRPLIVIASDFPTNLREQSSVISSPIPKLLVKSVEVLSYAREAQRLSKQLEMRLSNNLNSLDLINGESRLDGLN